MPAFLLLDSAMLSALQQVRLQQEQQVRLQQERKRLQQPERQPERKRLQQEREQQPEQEQRQAPVRRQALLRVFHRKRSKQEPTGQQQERRVSLSIPREMLKLNSRKFYLTLNAPRIRTRAHQKSKAAHSSACL